ncbi:MFS transporter [Coprobacter tertius]|uniref:MFS transporter n=1 Tax=Coprobacter tertius TaxID=2944915 RepID=A0ABT1MJX6_9BACT|nr:MFS transporter [Coprobacter tertius]MCP9611993.1 MFS transporter [Coprobacter tertius]
MIKKINNSLPAIFFGYFIMGLVDIVGVSANYVKNDFRLSDSTTSFLPMLAFISFAFLAIPSGLLMNKIGRKNSVLISFIITLVALVIPITGYSFGHMLTAFALVGIGNTLMQTSINPLLGDVVSAERLTSSLTLGQFFRSLSSALGPVLLTGILLITGNWRNLFILYAILTLSACIWLWKIPVFERKELQRRPREEKNIFLLFKDKYILMLFVSLFLFVGIDVGMNVNIPEFLRDRCGLSLTQAGLGPSLYFIARITGSLIGAFLMLRIRSSVIFLISMIIGVLIFTFMMLTNSIMVILICIFIIGLMCSNVFSILLALALQHRTERANEVSGLMIMAVSGGAVVPLLTGTLNDISGHSSGMYIFLACFILLSGAAIIIIRKKK